MAGSPRAPNWATRAERDASAIAKRTLETEACMRLGRAQL